MDFCPTDADSTDSNILEKEDTDLQAREIFIVFIIGQFLDETGEPEYRGLVLKVADESVSIYRRIGTYYGQCWDATTPEQIYAKEKIIILI